MKKIRSKKQKNNKKYLIKTILFSFMVIFCLISGNFVRAVEDNMNMVNNDIEENDIAIKVQVVNKKNGSNIPYGQATLEGAIYEFYNENKELIGTYESGKKGKFEINDLSFGTYYVKQIVASKGYLINEEEVKFDFNENNYELILKQDVIGADIEIKKVYGYEGNYEPEKYALFILYDNKGNMYGNLNTNQYGVISLWLAYGEYTLHQWTPMYGYTKVEDVFIEITEPKNEKIYYNLVSDLILTKVKVVSFEQRSGKQLDLSGFSYRIRKKDEIDYLEFEGNNIFTTDINGEIVIPISLPYGDYILEQVGVPEGVLLNEKEKEFSINDESVLSSVGDNLVIDIEFYNDLVMGKIKIFTDEERFYSEVNEYGYYKVPRIGTKISIKAGGDITIGNKVIYKKGDFVYSGTTGNEGNLIIDNLYLGSYCLIDEATSEEKCLKLESIDNKKEMIEKSITFTKDLRKGNIIIQNLSNEGETISESLFELLDKDGMVIYTGITNEEGIIKIDNLSYGDYCIRQKKVSSKYQFVGREMCFVLSEDKRIDFVNDIIVKKVISVPDTLLKSIGVYEAILLFVMIGTGIIVYKKIFASKLYR